MTRKGAAGIAAAVVVGGSIAIASLSGGTTVTKLYTCVKANDTAELGWTSTMRACPAGDRVVAVSASDVTPVPPTTVPPVATTAPPTTTTPACVGTPLTNGQADINAQPSGTTFCMTGAHNWTLAPKSNDTIIGGILDGGGVTQYATIANASTGVTLDSVEVRNYRPTYQHGAVQGGGSGWTLRNVLAHDNGDTTGGNGATLGPAWKIIGGRYWNNRESGIEAGGATGAVINGAELDHNNYTTAAYTTANLNCDTAAGGFKWVANQVTVTNSYVHDNACRGLWADINSNGSTITNNRVVNNWADGIMIEISGASTVTGNTVTGNGFREFSVGAGRTPTACSWGYGAGIFISTSGKTDDLTGTIEVSGNTVTGNCLPITGVDQRRVDSGHCVNVCELMHLRVHDNTMVGSTDARALNKFGAFQDDGDNLATHDIVFGPNSLSGVTNCLLAC